MDLVDALTIIAILVGPIAAVQVTRLLDARKERRERKYWIYRTLMATRAALLSPAHVEALNSIDLEFYSNKKNEVNVRTKWKVYLDHLDNRNIPEEQWTLKRVDLLVDLLEEMGNCLGYKFDKVHIKNAIYSPTAHGNIEREDRIIRNGIIQILQGTKTIPISVDSLPPQPH